MTELSKRDQPRSRDNSEPLKHCIPSGQQRASRPEVPIVVPHVSAEWVRSWLDSQELKLVDVRQALDRPSLYLPGAIRLDATACCSCATESSNAPAVESARLMASQGISDDHLVVAYDERDGREATEFVVKLLRLGHRRAAVLSGGLWAWSRANLPLVLAPAMPLTAAVTPPPPGWVSRRTFRSTSVRRRGT